MAAYGRVCQAMGKADNRQKLFHDEDTTRRFFKLGNWVLYCIKPKSLQTVPCGWTDPYVVVEKASPVDYWIQFTLDGKKKTVHCNEL